MNEKSHYSAGSDRLFWLQKTTLLTLTSLCFLDSDSFECDDTQTIASRISAISFRNKHETPEEKKARKEAVKELKRERRAEKKANKTAFRDEKRKQEKVELCNQKNAQVANGKRLV